MYQLGKLINTKWMFFKVYTFAYNSKHIFKIISMMSEYILNDLSFDTNIE